MKLQKTHVRLKAEAARRQEEVGHWRGKMCIDFQEMGLAAMDYPGVCKKLTETEAELKSSQEDTQEQRMKAERLSKQLTLLQQYLDTRDTQIEALQARVTVLSTTVDNLEASCDVLKEEKRKWHGQHSNLNRTITTLKATIYDLRGGRSQPRHTARQQALAHASVSPAPRSKADEALFQRQISIIKEVRERSTRYLNNWRRLQSRYAVVKTTPQVTESLAMIDTRTHGGSRAPCTAENILHTVEMIHAGDSDSDKMVVLMK